MIHQQKKNKSGNISWGETSESSFQVVGNRTTPALRRKISSPSIPWAIPASSFLASAAAPARRLPTRAPIPQGARGRGEPRRAAVPRVRAVPRAIVEAMFFNLGQSGRRRTTSRSRGFGWTCATASWWRATGAGTAAGWSGAQQRREPSSCSSPATRTAASRGESIFSNACIVISKSPC